MGVMYSCKLNQWACAPVLAQSAVLLCGRTAGCHPLSHTGCWGVCSGSLCSWTHWKSDIEKRATISMSSKTQLVLCSSVTEIPRNDVCHSLPSSTATTLNCAAILVKTVNSVGHTTPCNPDTLFAIHIHRKRRGKLSEAQTPESVSSARERH